MLIKGKVLIQGKGLPRAAQLRAGLHCFLTYTELLLMQIREPDSVPEILSYRGFSLGHILVNCLTAHI